MRVFAVLVLLLSGLANAETRKILIMGQRDSKIPVNSAFIGRLDGYLKARSLENYELISSELYFSHNLSNERLARLLDTWNPDVVVYLAIPERGNRPDKRDLSRADRYRELLQAWIESWKFGLTTIDEEEVGNHLLGQYLQSLREAQDQVKKRGSRLIIARRIGPPSTTKVSRGRSLPDWAEALFFRFTLSDVWLTRTFNREFDSVIHLPIPSPYIHDFANTYNENLVNWIRLMGDAIVRNLNGTEK